MIPSKNRGELGVEWPDVSRSDSASVGKDSDLRETKALCTIKADWGSDSEADCGFRE